MPHDGFHYIAGAAVVQAIAAAGVQGGKAAAPEGSGAAPAAVDVVFHGEAVLDHVGIGPDGLAGIARKRFGAIHGRGPVVVVSRGPGGFVAGGAANFREHFLSFLDVGVIEVAGAGNGQAAVPHHEGVELVGVHFRLEVVVRVVKLVGTWAQEREYRFRDLGVRDRSVAVHVYVVGGVFRIGPDGEEHLHVLRHGARPGFGGVEERTVGAGNVGDVPDGVGAGTVLQRAARHGVGELLEKFAVHVRVTGVEVALGVVAGAVFTLLPVVVEGSGGEIAGLCVPEGGIEVRETGFAGILLPDGFLRNGVEETGSGNADGAFQAEAEAVTLGAGRLVGVRDGVEGALRNGEFGVDEIVLFTVGEGHGKTAFHGRYRDPADMDLVFVDGRKERVHGHGLGHAGDLGHIGTVVGVLGALVVDDEEIAVAERLGAVGLVRVLPLAVSVAGVAVQTGFSHRCRSAALEGGLVYGDVSFKEGFAPVEGGLQSHLDDGGGGVFVRAGGDVQRGAQLSAGVPLIGRKVPDGLSDILGVGLFGCRHRPFAGLLCAGDEGRSQSNEG